MSVAIITDAGSTRAYVRTDSGTGDLSWTQNAGEALLFSDSTGANAWLAAHNAVTYPTSLLNVSGDEDYSTETLT
jgi:hypothetical protein